MIIIFYQTNTKLKANPIFYFAVNGQGYQPLGTKVDLKISSSPKNPFPTPFAGTNPIFLQLEPDANKFVKITFAQQVIVAGLSIQTPENMALKKFTLSYAERSLQYPDKMITIARIFDAAPQVGFSKYKRGWGRGGV